MPKKLLRLLTAAAVIVGLAIAPTASAAPNTPPPAAQSATAQSAAAATDPFYAYAGSRPLSSYAPGDVLKTRTMSYHFFGIPTPLPVTQLLYRSTDAQGRPSANVTSVVRSLDGDSSKALSYQSAYDSLNPEDGPSRAIAGDLRLGGVIANAESLILVPALLQGYDVIIPDTEGQTANFAAGPEYGTNTLDSIRAATRSPETGMNADTRFGLIGYSGGAIATNWAAALAPDYAPEVNERLVGFTEGGMLVTPAHNLKYVNGSLVWSAVIAMAAVGVARAYDIDLTPYMSSYAAELFEKHHDASIIEVIARYPGLTWQKLVKPQYNDPNSVPEFLEAVNKVNIGSAPTPTVPAFIVQGNNGGLEGTFSNLPGIGPGDGVMVSGDIRSLARQYCATGNRSIKYHQYDLLSHGTATVPWFPQALLWLNDRFAGKPAPSSCGRIAPGNSLAPETPTPPA